MSRIRARLISFARTAAVLSAALLAAALPLPAQTVTGTLQGTVTDTDGGALPGVGVGIKNLETGLERNVFTNERGFYKATFLPLGLYRVSASLMGFGNVVKDKVEIALNQTTVTDFTLNPRVTAEVKVTGEQPRINTVNAEIKGSLTAEQIEDKPTVLAEGRTSFLSLAEIFAGFQENPTSGQNNPTASSGSSINFSGTGTRGATFQINGVNNDDSSENQHRQGVALATIKEFQVISNNFSAEFGGSHGTVVLVQTKSGTNDLKGELYGRHTTSRWAEKGYFSKHLPKPINERAGYGFAAGFPVMEDKLFGFISGDEFENDGRLGYTRTVFTQEDLERPRLTRGNDTPANRAFIDSVLARFQNARPNDPSRGPRVFASQIDTDFPDRDYSARLDYILGISHNVTGRYQWSRNIRFADDIIIGERADQNHKQQNYSATWTHVFSPRTGGEFRYGLGLRDTNVEITAGNDTPVIRFAGSTFPTIIGNAGNFPINRDQRDDQFVYNLSTLFGSNHYVKAGTDIRLQQLDDVADNFSRGFYSFSTPCGGVSYPSSFAAFLDGCVTTYQKAYGHAFLENRINVYNFYLEDNWQLFPNLTLNLGVRYEYVEAPEEDKGRIEYAFEDDTDNIGPRLGFAYSPGWDKGFLAFLTGGPGNASIRGGYGEFHGRIFQSVFSQGGASVRFNPPNALFRTFNTLPDVLNLADPTGGFVFVPGTIPTVRYSITIPDPDLEMPETRRWNVTFERKMPWNSSIRLTYERTTGDLLRYEQDNLPIPPFPGGPFVVAADARCAGTGLPGIPTNATCPDPVPIEPNEISQRVPRTNERRPDARYGTNTLVTNNAESKYEGLQVEWNKRFSQGLHFQMSYTYSEYKDTVSEATFVGGGDTNFTGPDRKFAWGYSRFHTPHRFTLNGVYALPFFKDRKDFLGQALGGWRLSATVRIASGTPFTVIDTGVGDINFDGYSENRPIIVDRSILERTINHPSDSQQRLTREAFRRTRPGDSPEDIVPRNIFFSDGKREVDIGLYKTFRLPWEHQLMFQAQVFNSLNYTQFGFPVTDLALANFGQITTQVNSPRRLQFGLRYIF